MHKRITFLFLCLAVLAPSLAQADSSASDPVASMSLEHKVAQMFMVTLHGRVMTESGADFIRKWQPGGVVLFAENAGNPSDVTKLTNDFQQTITAAGGPPMFISTDQEGNTVARLTDGFTVFPNPLLTTAAGEEMAYRVGQATAEELRAVGINMNLAPVADLETNLNNPVIHHRSYGSHPEVTGKIVAQLVRGMQSLGVMATAKHFPGHGETDQDSHGTLPILDISKERLLSLETVPFRYAEAAGVASIMVAHIWFPAVDPVEVPSSISHNVVTGLLRDEMGFNGLIMTDAMDMNAVDMTVNYQESMVMAVQAGIDLMTMGPGFGTETTEKAMQAVVDAVRSGRIPESRIDESVRRIIAAKARYGILDWQPLDPATAAQRVNLDAHTQLVDELYQDGTTLAYDDNHLLPLDISKKITMVFLATRYQIKNECEKYDPNIRWVGVGDAPSGDEIGWASGAARDADITVVWTQDAISNINQQNLVNALPPERTVVVALWSPYDWQKFPRVDAYMMTFSPGRPAVPAACSILFGASPALGQLPVSLSLELQAGAHAPS